MARGEFDLIRDLFAPLSDAAHGFWLTDDAARMSALPGHNLVATADMLVSGVHFAADAAADVIARKALRVNLSDLAAMGARPKAYLLSLALPNDLADGWIESFAKGLAADNELFAVVLAGGDTVATPGSLTINITALGELREGAALRRSGAKVGDQIFVSGTIGDAALALAADTGKITVDDPNDLQALRTRLLLPEPRVTLGARLLGLAHACIDVSDGLVADLGHIVDQSGVAAEIEFSSVPLSTTARKCVDQSDDHVTSDNAVRVLTGGDDYELLFTAPPDLAGVFDDLSIELGIPITAIGNIVKGEGVSIRGTNGDPMTFEKGGFTHF